MRDIRFVVLWMMGALVSFSTLAVSIRELSHGLNVYEMLAIRNFGGIVALAGYALARRERVAGPFPLRIHLLRNVFHFGGQTAWVYGVTMLPLATVFSLEFTSPAWTTILAVLFLGERLTAARVGAVALGFAGVMVILQPGIGTFQPAALVVLGAAACFGVQLTTTKFLTGSNSVLTIMMWMNLMQLPMYLAVNVATGGAWWFGDKLVWSETPWLLALCLAGLLAHVCLTNAFRFGDAIVVVPIDFLRIPLIATVGMVLYGERFDPVILLGAGVIVSGIVWNLRDSGRKA
jgi:drug/metabolite transporter (DMT)-like permease